MDKKEQLVGDFKNSIPHRQATNKDGFDIEIVASKVSIPHRQATNKDGFDIEIVASKVSIPHRQATNTTLTLQTLSRVKIQFLIGRLQTYWMFRNKHRKFKVSIPHRQATNEAAGMQ